MQKENYVLRVSRDIFSAIKKQFMCLTIVLLFAMQENLDDTHFIYYILIIGLILKTICSFFQYSLQGKSGLKDVLKGCVIDSFSVGCTLILFYPFHRTRSFECFCIEIISLTLLKMLSERIIVMRLESNKLNSDR